MFPSTFDFLLFLHAFPAIVALSCFFMRFLPLWLYLVSLHVSYHCGFARFHFALLSQIKIHPYPFIQGHYGLSAIYWVGLANLFCFLFSSFIHYSELAQLTLLLSFLFIYSLHWPFRFFFFFFF